MWGVERRSIFMFGPWQQSASLHPCSGIHRQQHKRSWELWEQITFGNLQLENLKFVCLLAKKSQLLQYVYHDMII